MEEDGELFVSGKCITKQIQYKNLVLGEIYSCLMKCIVGDRKEALNAFIHTKRMI